jgi:PAS domain S-box-containing protein/putative nucleotidyltransferase with HDIG domain
MATTGECSAILDSQPAKWGSTVSPFLSSDDASIFCSLSPDLHCILTAKGRFVWASSRWDSMLGHAPEDLAGTSFFDLLQDHDVASVRDALVRATENRSSASLLVRIRRGKGEPIWVEWRFGASGDGAIYGFGRDVTERRRSAEAVEALRTVEDEAEQIAELGSWRYEPATGSLTWSPQLYRLYGVDPSNPGLDPRKIEEEAIHPDDREMVRSVHRMVLAEDVPQAVHYRIVLPGNEIHWVEVRSRQARNAAGRVVAITGFTQDVTERKQAEVALRDSEQRFRAMFEQAAVGMAQVGTDGSWLKANDRFCEIVGYTHEELGALTFPDITYPADLPGSLHRRDRMLGGTTDSYEVEKRYVRKDGSIVWVDLADAAVRDEDGAARYFVTVIQDISKRRQAEQALAESERFVQSILDTTPNLIYIYSVAEQRNVYANREVSEFLGYTPEEVREFGATLFECILHPDDAALVTEHHIACTRASDGETLECEYRIRHSDGAWRWLRSRDVVFTRDENGAATEILGFCQDVTGRKQTDEALLESNVRLERMVYDVAEAMGRVIEVRDPYTRGHQERVARISKAIAVEMGLPEDDAKAVEMAALVHDIGKLSVPAEILSMPRALTSLEFSLIQEHPMKGYEILKDIDFPWPIADIVLQHHERLDGSGYPAGLRDEVLLPARILTVADVVEAMASHRPYRPALGLPCAMAELKDHPEKYDSAVVAACVRLCDRGEIEL